MSKNAMISDTAMSVAYSVADWPISNTMSVSMSVTMSVAMSMAVSETRESPSSIVRVDWYKVVFFVCACGDIIFAITVSVSVFLVRVFKMFEVLEVAMVMIPISPIITKVVVSESPWS